MITFSHVHYGVAMDDVNEQICVPPRHGRTSSFLAAQMSLVCFWTCKQSAAHSVNRLDWEHLNDMHHPEWFWLHYFGDANPQGAILIPTETRSTNTHDHLRMMQSSLVAENHFVRKTRERSHCCSHSQETWKLKSNVMCSFWKPADRATVVKGIGSRGLSMNLIFKL